VSKSKIFSISILLVLAVFVAGALAQSKKRGHKSQSSPTSKAKSSTSAAALSTGGSGRAFAYPEELRFFTVTYPLDEENGSDELREVDILTGETLDEMPLTLDDEPVFAAASLATDPTDGTVFILVKREAASEEDPQGFSGAEPNAILGTVDVSTGEVTEIAELDGHFSEMAFDDEGTLYGVTGAGYIGNDPLDRELHTIDKETGESEFVQTLNETEWGHGLEFNPEDGRLYHYARTFDEGGGLFQSFVPGDDPVEISISGEAPDSGTFLRYLGNDSFIFGEWGNNYLLTADGEISFLSAFDHGASGLAATGSFVPEVNDGDSVNFVLVIPDTEDTNGETYTFECTGGLPDGASCSFDPDEVTVEEGAVSTTLTVNTDGTASLFPSNVRGTFAMWSMLPGFAMIGLVVGRKNTRVRNSMMLLLLLSVMMLMPACSGESERFGDDGGNGDFALVTVTATSENDTQTFQVALNVI
jgi:hypothetical protein